MNEHPNLHPEIYKRIQEQEETGTKVEIQTLNTLYILEPSGKEGRNAIVQGGKFFPEPTEAGFGGSTWGGSMLKLGWIGHQMCLELVYTRPTGEPGCVTTSLVQSAKIVGPDWEYEMEWDDGEAKRRREGALSLGR